MLTRKGGEVMSHAESTLDRIGPWLVLLPLLTVNIVMFFAWN